MTHRPFLLFLLLLSCTRLLSAQDSGETGYRKLVSLDAQLRELRQVKVVDGVPDYSPEGVSGRKETLAALRSELATLDAADWPVSRKVDLLIVWSKLNEMDFDHRVLQPWARDPLFYLDQVRRIPYANVPATEEDASALADRLASVRLILSSARAQLTRAVGELARLTLFHLDNFDGVGQGEPYRDDPPEGTLGWYRDLCQRLNDHGSSVETTCREATSAVADYRDWLAGRLGELPASAGIGTENYNWYLKHIRLLPYTVDQLILLGERELHRYRAAYEMTRRKNRSLAALELTGSRDEHERRTRSAEEQIRALIANHDLLSIPEDTPDQFETDTFWSPRAPTTRHFWEELQFRNALNNHVHASFPGHRFDALFMRRIGNPVRRGFRDGARGEGWATYIEEMLLLSGLTDEVPRAQELFYIALMKRASRIFAETKMHSGEFALPQANQYMIDNVPFMEEKLGRYDFQGYLRRPGSGSSYIVGKMQIEKLLSERALQLGDGFDLGRFHDAILSSGGIPITLLRFELTGYDDEVRALWPDVVGRPFFNR